MDPNICNFPRGDTLAGAVESRLTLSKLDMCTATFLFLGDLEYFLLAEHRGCRILVALNGTVAVKHSIESLGVPHPEVGLIMANGVAVDFGYRLQAGDVINVHPWMEAPGDVPHGQLRPRLERPVRFVIDTHLGQLAAYLRLFGFDSLYANDYDDATLAHIAQEQGRLLLTRDRGLLKRRIVVHGHCVRSSVPRQQLIDVLQRYNLRQEIQPWRRCLRCNGMLEAVPKDLIWDRLEPRTKLYYERFWHCTECDQVYWQGSHHGRMQEFIDEVLADFRQR